jgi:hypothetical protein
MEIRHLEEPQRIMIRPAAVFAFMVFLMGRIALLLLAWRVWPGLIWFSLLTWVYILFRQLAGNETACTIALNR